MIWIKSSQTMRGMNREKEEAAPAAQQREADGRASTTQPDRTLVRVLVQAQREVEFELEMERRALNRDDLL